MENANSVPKPSFDPGWNDPPKFSYNAQQNTSGKPRINLNKRVAFPLSAPVGSYPVPGPTPPMNLPPMPNMSPIPVQNIQNLPQDSITSNINSEDTLTEVKTILLDFLESSSELGPKANEIKKRISFMEDMWLGGKLNIQVQARMKELACALKEDQPSLADEIHRALMVDHVTAVGTWMPGVKQLIHHCIARSELLSIDKE